MTDADIERVVAGTLAKQPSVDEAVDKTVKRVLESLGIDADDYKEVRADMLHLRFWRKSFNRASNVGAGAAITTLVVGGLAFVGASVRAKMGW